MNVVLSRDALADLDEIGDWIASDDADRAERFVTALQRRCATLSQQPKRFPVVRRTAMLELRKFSYRRYLIFYSLSDDGVEVLRIVHGSRDWAEIVAALG